MTTVAANTISDAARLLLEAGAVHELRILNTNQKTVSGYFDDFDKLAEAAAAWDGKAPGIYVTLNPVNPDLLSRSANHVIEWARHTTSDTDIVRRKWLPIDCDPVRPSGISATDAEHEAALACAKRIGNWLVRECGWPMMVLADSGNGGHLICPIDLPNDQDSTILIQRCLEALDLLFSDGAVAIDVKNYNAGRIWKLYGTIAAKGDSTPERPHRGSGVLRAPDELKVVDIALLKTLAGMAPRPEAKGVRGDFDLESWIAEHNLAVARTGMWNGGTKWVLSPCPWDSGHTDNSAYIVQFSSGAIAAGCQHNGCAGKDWKALREMLEPDYVFHFSGNGTAPVDEPGEVRTFPRTDAGNAELFAHLYGDKLRFDHRRKRWLLWAGHWWQPDADAQVRLLAKQAARQRYQQAASIDDLKEREKVANWAIGAESRMRMDATLSLAQAEPPIADSGEHWDTDPWLLGVANGVVDLRTGQLRPGRQDDRITMHSRVTFDAEAKCPRWELFLQEVFAGDPELVDYIWRALGYSLTAVTREQCLFICYGSGWNGKSRFREVQEAVLGEYAGNTPFSTLEYSGRYSIPNDVAALHGKRVVTACEISEGRRLNEARLKMLAGEDPVPARFLYGEFFTFRPVAKFWLSVNHKPHVDDDSSGFWRKIRLIPFTQSFKGRADKELDAKLLAEAPGVLAWMVRGCLEWQKRGLEAPQKVTVATEQYRTESDPLADFTEEACIVKPDATVKAGRLYKLYKKWAEDAGLKEREVLSSTKFGRIMGDRFTRRHDRSGWWYDGVQARVNGLNDEADNE